ncbi:MAG: type I-E CRISPR-associated protein Cas7/Cse4/CasC [Deltaproteobacteria bacterium]|nr:MAG: type I-E CRISPR-associated protein Cas7/Cse4/CasC [Deltaproteobacteria bacterium]
MFLQIHYLTSYHATLLNRDDAGLAKRIPFGGTVRLRVSSQCQKRHWREWLAPRADLPTGIRSRHFFDREIRRRLVDEAGMAPEFAHELVFALGKGLLTAAGEKDALDKETLAMKQPVLFGKPEADYLVELLKEAAGAGDGKAAVAEVRERIRKDKKNFKALMRQAGFGDPVAGVDGAMFGRFVTSDILARVDAPVHVAHAFTTHALDTEVDFFTVVDDLSEEETGAAHANDMELGAGIFYGYVVVDVPLLVSNLTGADPLDWKQQDPGSAKRILDLLIHAVAEVSPGAKLGATAPYARAEHLVLETGRAQPRSLSNAFLEPVSLGGRAHPMKESVRAMASHIDALEGMYGKTGVNRHVSGIHGWPRENEPVASLQETIDRAMGDIFGG